MFLGRSGQFLSLTSRSLIKHHAGFQYHQHAVSMESLILLNFLHAHNQKNVIYCHLLVKAKGNLITKVGIVD